MESLLKACDSEECSSVAAYGTRTRTAYCDAHIAEHLAVGGMEPLEPVRSHDGHYLMRCLSCACVAHYRFSTHLEYRERDELTCRACFWREWTLRTDAWLWSPAPSDVEIQELCQENGYRWLESLTNPLIGAFAYRVECTKCDRIKVERTGDIGWGCTCGSNSQKSVGGVQGQSKKTELFKDCGEPEVELWDHARNTEHDWHTATTKATRFVHWRCPECGGPFQRKIYEIFYKDLCQPCQGTKRQKWDAYWADMETKTVADFPELVAAWADDTDPRLASMTGWELRRFKCPKGHFPTMSPTTFLDGGCDRCKGIETRRQNAQSGETDLLPELIAQWHRTKNGNLAISKVRQSSKRQIWWQCAECNHEWQQEPLTRNKYRRLRCPECETILDSMGHHFPELAAEWSPRNPTSALHVRPTAKTEWVPEWICSTNPDHTWTASLPSRRAGAGCPECRLAGKSKIELEHLKAAEAAFGKAASGKKTTVIRGGFKWSWFVDITIGADLIVEYDGAYWHRDKMDTDRRKSQDLLEADYKVVRLRENGLPSLGIDHPHYLELPVYSSAPDADGTMARILAWSLETSKVPSSAP